MTMKMLMKIKILDDEASDWLKIWTVASLLDMKGNKAMKKKKNFLTNRSFFSNTVTFYLLLF